MECKGEESLHDIRNAEWFRLSLELKAKNLVGVRIERTVLKAPHETHQVGPVRIALLLNTNCCDACHDDYDNKIKEYSFSGANFVNNPSRYNPSKHLSESKSDQCKQCQ